MYQEQWCLINWGGHKILSSESKYRWLTTEAVVIPENIKLSLNEVIDMFYTK